ncbi:hypothetical protein [Burkholderia sp. Nafp2/4-1b]|uniref:hypothetical protein n=1 Tax=Burkholderia sp. Nafp2/4-1b TaxID=2116686 RepID=UPI0013CE710F|nr:hypothetical protein [Burkholderia sp. Nafp2/4-1b]
MTSLTISSAQSSAIRVYFEYVTELTQLLIAILRARVFESNGRRHQQGSTLLSHVVDFIAKWNNKSIGTFPTKEGARKFAGQFKTEMIKVVKTGNNNHDHPNSYQVFSVEISLLPLTELITAASDNDKHAKHLKVVMGELTSATPPDSNTTMTPGELLKLMSPIAQDNALARDWIQLKRQFSHMSDRALHDYLLRIFLDNTSNCIEEWEIKDKHFELIETLWRNPGYFNKNES